MSRSNYHSGYMNVDVLTNQDLFPDEGYQFPPSKARKPTNTRESSTQNPLNNKINDQAIEIAKEKIGSPIQPPAPPVDQTVHVDRTKRGKYILESTIKTRTKQIQYHEEMEKYKKEANKTNDVILEEQLRIAKEEALKEEQKQHNQTTQLAQAYTQQLQAVNERKAKEREAEKKYEEQLLEADRRAMAEEEEKKRKNKEIQKERREEFERKNQELLEARKTRHQRELEEEKRLQKESAEDQERRAARAQEDERRRLEKTKMRARVVERQAKNLETMKSKIDTREAIAESEAQKNAEKAEAAKIEKKRKAEEERRNDLQKLQKENMLNEKKVTKKPFPLQVPEQDADEFAQIQKKNETKRYKLIQAKQMEILKQKEKEEKEQELVQDKKMLEMSQKQFSAKLDKLQKIVPPELGINVHEFQFKKSFK